MRIGNLKVLSSNEAHNVMFHEQHNPNEQIGTLSWALCGPRVLKSARVSNQLYAQKPLSNLLGGQGLT